ncbi:MAG: hypothetical protein HY556_10050 [Euryarchaeota archaeon]|nr:hypothetical protein [Euryarchaeota archaeon]
MELDESTRGNVFKGGAAAAVVVLAIYFVLLATGPIDGALAYLLLLLLIVILAAVGYVFRDQRRTGSGMDLAEPEPLAADTMTIEAQPVETGETPPPAARALDQGAGGGSAPSWETPKQPVKRIRCKSCATIFNFDDAKPVQTCPNCGRSGTATRAP